MRKRTRCWPVSARSSDKGLSDPSDVSDGSDPLYCHTFHAISLSNASTDIAGYPSQTFPDARWSIILSKVSTGTAG
jgi:hypothetical protein